MFSISDKNVMTLSKGDTAYFTVNIKNADGTDYTLYNQEMLLHLLLRKESLQEFLL